MNDMGVLKASEKASAQVTADVLELISRLATGNPGLRLKLESTSATGHAITLGHDWYGLGSGKDYRFEIETKVTIVTRVIVPRVVEDEE
jgi:hypothetical protein